MAEQVNKVTPQEFMVCVKAIFGFAVGYKVGEKYRLGFVLEGLGKWADAEAFQAGLTLANSRTAYQVVS